MVKLIKSGGKIMYQATTGHPTALLEGLPGKNGLYGQDILAVSQFDRENLDYLFALAERMRDVVETGGGVDLLKHRVLAALFYEPSTRTSASFIAAMERLGGSVIPITQGVQFSSVSKGESLPDTVRTLEQYADAIVLRHPETGSVAIAARYAQKPVINAGDGTGEHPTQALLDLFTILEELGTIDELTVAMVGDLRFGRTVHSLTQLLLNYNVRLRFVSPEILRAPLDLTNKVRDVIGEADVLYVTRVQKERFSDLAQYEQVKDYYLISPALLERAKPKMVVMHPLPRVGEISYEVDEDPRAAYFRQVRNGLYIRMALLAAVLAKRGA
jgi:aspartate carbamoyltransferase catalytic subunit